MSVSTATRRPPKYGKHKPSGRARIVIDGKSIYLGEYGSPESWEAYRRTIAEWQANQTPPDEADASLLRDRLTINELIERYWEFAREHYADAESYLGLSKEGVSMLYALNPLKDQYGETFVREFGPKRLKALRDRLVTEKGWARSHINRQLNRIKRAFRWGVEEELVAPAIYDALRVMQGLRRRSNKQVREAPKIVPVIDLHVAWILPYVNRQVRAMIFMQRLTGARPGEICRMRKCDISVSGDVWHFRPESHKNAWRGKTRTIFLSPTAQAVLQPFFDREPEAFLFSPAEAESERHAEMRRNRKTRVQPSQKNRRKRSRRKKPGDSYTTESYCRAIKAGCRKAGIPAWSPNQLRHSVATELTALYGIETARIILGHDHIGTTNIYAEKDMFCLSWTLSF